MDTTTGYRWTISAVTAPHPWAEGTADDLTGAWTTALRAARAGLLGGQLPDLAISVNGQPEAILFPRRDPAGAVDAAEVTASLVEMHQGATAHLIAALLTRPPTDFKLT